MLIEKCGFTISKKHIKFVLDIKFMTKIYRFFIERSPTPIFQRIIENIEKVLVEFGHTVIPFNPSDFQNDQKYIDYINRHNIDYCIISNSHSILSSYSLDIDSFLFEKVNASLIFIHHDDPFSGYFSLDDVQVKLQTYLNTKNKSFHFFIEYSNFADFKYLDINNSFIISHSSEFKPTKKSFNLEKADVSFVGHVLPGNDSYLEELPFSYLLKRDYWTRVSSINEVLENSAYLFAKQNCGDFKNQFELYSLKFFYRAMLHKLSQSFRGEIISRISDNFNVSIYGGDPSYLHNGEHSLILDKENLNYYPATLDYAFSNQIYTNSKINLNITSLQFDTAIINRVIDIGSSGGFILTDWKSDLHKITSVSEEISYSTIDELNSKIEYYLIHDKERQEIAVQLHEDISSKCSYSNLMTYIISQLSPISVESSDSTLIDLGSSSFKPDLRAANIIILLDWNQSEDFLNRKLVELFQNAISFHYLDSLGILFYLNGQVVLEDAQLIISSVIMDLYLKEIIVDPDCFHVDFVPEVSNKQWESLLPSLSGKVILDHVFLLRILDAIPVYTDIELRYFGNLD
jgi:hypothetical protein